MVSFRAASQHEANTFVFNTHRLLALAATGRHYITLPGPNMPAAVFFELKQSKKSWRDSWTHRMRPSYLFTTGKASPFILSIKRDSCVDNNGWFRIARIFLISDCLILVFQLFSHMRSVLAGLSSNLFRLQTLSSVCCTWQRDPIKWVLECIKRQKCSYES